MRSRGGYRRAAAAWLILCGTAHGAAAAGSPPPPRPPPPITPYVGRGVLYGAGQAGITLGVTGTVGPGQPGKLETTLEMGLGVTDRLSLEGNLGRLTLAPALDYRHPEIGLWVGILDSQPLELDATVHAVFGAGREGSLHELTPGLVAVARAGTTARIDLGAYMPMLRDETETVGLRAPVQVALQINPYLHAALSSGVMLPRLGEGRFEVPLGMSLGCTVPLDGGGYAVVSPSLTWPRIAGTEGTPGRELELGVALSVVTP